MGIIIINQPNMAIIIINSRDTGHGDK